MDGMREGGECETLDTSPRRDVEGVTRNVPNSLIKFLSCDTPLEMV